MARRRRTRPSGFLPPTRSSGKNIAENMFLFRKTVSRGEPLELVLSCPHRNKGRRDSVNIHEGTGARRTCPGPPLLQVAGFTYDLMLGPSTAKCLGEHPAIHLALGGVATRIHKKSSARPPRCPWQVIHTHARKPAHAAISMLCSQTGLRREDCLPLSRAAGGQSEKISPARPAYFVRHPPEGTARSGAAAGVKALPGPRVPFPDPVHGPGA